MALSDQESKFIAKILSGSSREIIEAVVLNPNVARLFVHEFRGTFLSNAGGTSLSVTTQPTNWTGSADYRTYIKTIRAQAFIKGATTVLNHDTLCALQFQIRDTGRNFDWFDDQGLLFSSFFPNNTDQVFDQNYPIGWVTPEGTDVKCSYSYNSDIVAGLGTSVEYYAVVSLIGLQVRV